MILKTVILFLFSKTYLKNNDLSYISNKNNSYEGFDMRENNNDNIPIYNISIFFYKKNLLDVLNNDNINIHKKLNYIDKYDKIFNENKHYNLYDGGLMKDWDF
jgi:hypothetical protein